MKKHDKCLKIDETVGTYCVRSLTVLNLNPPKFILHSGLSYVRLSQVVAQRPLEELCIRWDEKKRGFHARNN